MNKKIDNMKKTLSMLAIMSAVLVSCAKSEVTNPDANASISVSPTELNFDATGGDKTVTITSTGEWSVYTSDDWFELSATSGQNGDKITISADPYDNTEEERYAYIEFYCGSSATSLSITQSAKENSITVTPTEIKAEAEGGKYEITVTSTDEWTVTADNWITLSADKGNNGDIVTLSIDYNETAGERTGTATFDCKGKTSIITVTQQPDNSPIIQFKDPYFLDALLETYSVWWDTVKYDVDVDKNNDGQISESEAASVEVLDLYTAQNQSGNDIRNVDELRYFTGLRYLDYRYCPIAILDLNANTKLEKIYVQTPEDGQLSSLKIENCTYLKELRCSGNQLTSLDVSNCTALTYLDCGGNQLTSLDVSNCTALTYLDCGSKLTSLDVSNCAALIYLSCSGELSTLDLSNNTALTELRCSGNELSTLDLSKNTALTELYCTKNQLTSLDLSNCTALTNLYCYNNQLTTLDLSNCTALTNLDCYNNQLTTLDLSSCTALTDLDCYNNQLTSLTFCDYPVLESLGCQNNQFTSLNLDNCTALTWLYCYSNPLTSLDVSKCQKLDTFKCVDFTTKYSSPGVYVFDEIISDTKCPLESLVLYKYYYSTMDSDCRKAMEKAYSRVIEYAE